MVFTAFTRAAVAVAVSVSVAFAGLAHAQGRVLKIQSAVPASSTAQ